MRHCHFFMKQFILYAICLSTALIFAQNAKIDRLTVRLAYQNKDSTKIETSLLLINELYALKDYDKALLFIDQTAELSNSLNYDKGSAQSNYYKGLIFSNKNDGKNAVVYFEKALNSFKILNDTIGIAKVNGKLGIIQIERGNFKKGLQNSLSAISIFEEEDLKDDLSNAYNSLAKAYFKSKKFDKALQYNKKSLRIREELDDLEGMKYTLKNLGELYALKNNYRLSIDNYERMLTLLNNKKDKDLRGEVMTSLGKSYLAINDLKKAAEYLRAGLAFNRIQGNDLGVLISLNAFADLNIKNNRLRLAKTQLDEANKLGKKLNNEEELLYNYKLNTELSSVRNFHQDAFYWQKQYFYLKEKLNKEKLEALTLQIKSNQASNISTNLVSLKEKNKNIPEKKGSKLSSSQKQNTLLIYGLIASLVFVTALLIFSYLKSSKNTTTTKELSKKNESLVQKNKSLVQKNIQLEEVNK